MKEKALVFKVSESYQRLQWMDRFPASREEREEIQNWLGWLSEIREPLSFEMVEKLEILRAGWRFRLNRDPGSLAFLERYLQNPCPFSLAICNDVYVALSPILLFEQDYFPEYLVEDCAVFLSSFKEADLRNADKKTFTELLMKVFNKLNSAQRFHIILQATAPEHLSSRPYDPAEGLDRKIHLLKWSRMNVYSHPKKLHDIQQVFPDLYKSLFHTLANTNAAPDEFLRAVNWLGGRNILTTVITYLPEEEQLFLPLFVKLESVKKIRLLLGEEAQRSAPPPRVPEDLLTVAHYFGPRNLFGEVLQAVSSLDVEDQSRIFGVYFENIMLRRPGKTLEAQEERLRAVKALAYMISNCSIGVQMSLLLSMHSNFGASIRYGGQDKPKYRSDVRFMSIVQLALTMTETLQLCHQLPVEQLTCEMLALYRGLQGVFVSYLQTEFGEEETRGFEDKWQPLLCQADQLANTSDANEADEIIPDYGFFAARIAILREDEAIMLAALRAVDCKEGR